MQFRQEPGPRRGLAEAAKLVPAAVQETLSEEEVLSIRQLLQGAAEQTKADIFTEDTIAPYLTALVEGTPLAAARIESAQYTQLGSQEAYQNLGCLIGQYPLGDKQNGAFNIWVVRSAGAWVVKYSRVPNGGNLRSAPRR